MLIIVKLGEAKEEKGTGFVPIFRFTPFGCMLSLILQSDRPDVEAKLHTLLQGLLAPLEAQSCVIFRSNWLKKGRKDCLVIIFRYLKRSSNRNPFGTSESLFAKAQLKSDLLFLANILALSSNELVQKFG